jgi:uncharacterized protein (TIGR00369 family)
MIADALSEKRTQFAIARTMAMDNTGPHNIQMDKWIECAPFEQLLKMEIVEASDGRAMLRMPFVSDFAQGAGLMHGGALVSLADTAMIVAIKSLVAPGTLFATTEIQCKFISHVRQGIVTAKAKVLKPMGSVLYGSATIFDDRERPVLDFTSAFRMTNKNIQPKDHGELGRMPQWSD